ncbi:MAG: hypothetical protein A2836_02750 [Candidatus Taylorbacteria bacterium RIFCSPHIGHO2_01_FULL_45_63]|uniref:Ribosomal RNA small subunit methyltransferase E n=1 Tax=Candidatus Taylorbacteria bacterium RIFCSPHIGHO2_02_FULL_45_35 TaxID=1802311 RepID=A0A1G2MRS0_9BACT|nr:MAG: hypothetical protein A2836_02750 [Candidatus Taylorbacteria bacterium RIFCSPHIGHO2_01_FULL_45_63]OHA25701.1 MAG: hypothetical protein A3D56_00825 [Candidatus Taylorbacteria bacterium RIFCSPHIGHO2_02_FULL_45_35]
MTLSNSELLYQWRHVFRFNVGSFTTLFDNSGFEALCQIAELSFREASLLVVKKEQNTMLPRREVFLYQSIIKGGNFDLVLEKCTELGVSHFVPVLSDRSEKKNINMERSLKIVKEASEQSGRGILPTMSEPVSLGDAVSSPLVNPIAFHPYGSPFRESKILPARTTGIVQSGGNLESTSVLIGPEGGWSDREISLFEKKAIPLYSLGSTILRAETATIAATSLLLL